MDQDLQGVLFFYTMIAIAVTVILHGQITRPGKAEITIWLGLSAVYVMLYSRLGFAERSHLFEYSVLAIFIHKALIEREIQGKKKSKPALFAFLTAFAIGVLDEFIQLFLPSRVFDPIDILFNGFVAFMAIGASMAILWVRKKISKEK
jgi:VanZ family protein